MFFFPQSKIAVLILTKNFGCQKHRSAKKSVTEISEYPETGLTMDLKQTVSGHHEIFCF